jgi:uncharacterized membrane protein
MSISRLSLLAGAALIVAAVSFSASDVKAQQAVARAAVAPAAGALPLGLRCIVTLDPRATDDSVPAHEAMKKTGRTAEDTVEGTLVAMGGEWLVLKDGTYENWIPRDKVLFMRVSR